MLTKHALSILMATALTLANSLALAQSSEAPAPAGDLTAKVYSETAAELFWVRLSRDPSTTHEIRRDGELIDTIGNASSYYDDTLAAGRSYTYEVTVINSSDERSEPATVNLQSFAAAGSGGITTVIGPDDPDAILRGLRASVYSSSALELFWDRVPGVENYEIERNGELVDVVIGNSFFDDRLDAATSYAYTVYPVVADSTSADASASVVVNTHVSPDGINSDQAMLLRNARITIYSDTAAELFWDRPSEDVGVASVDVMQDGRFLGNTIGTSWFDDTRQAETRYTYTLVARNAIGAELERIIVQEGSADAEAPIQPFISPILAEWNTSGVAKLVYSILSGQVFGNDLLALPAYNDALYFSPGQILGSTVNAEPANDVCSNGGTADITPQTNASGAAIGWNFNFEDCLNDLELINGEMSKTLGSEFVVESSGITLEHAEEIINFSGEMRRLWAAPIGSPAGAGNSTPRHLIVNELNWRVTQFDGTLDISDANFTYSNNLDTGVSISGGFKFSSSLVQNQIVTVEIVDTLNHPEQVNGGLNSRTPIYTGFMRISAEDGSIITINYDNGLRETSSSVRQSYNEDVYRVVYDWSITQSQSTLFFPDF